VIALIVAEDMEKLAALLVVLAILYYVGQRMAWHSGRLAGLHEAERSLRHRQRCDYERGVAEGCRRVSAWLREHGRAKEAAELPGLTLTVDDQTEGGRQP